MCSTKIRARSFSFLQIVHCLCGQFSLPVKGYGSFFPRVKGPRCEVDHLLTSSAEVKERVELYLYSPSWPSWSVLGSTLPFPLQSPALLREIEKNRGNKHLANNATKKPPTKLIFIHRQTDRQTDRHCSHQNTGRTEHCHCETRFQKCLIFTKIYIKRNQWLRDLFTLKLLTLKEYSADPSGRAV